MEPDQALAPPAADSPPLPPPAADRRWNVRQTHTLLDLIRDLGLAGLLNRRGHQNREVFQRLQAVLQRCNLRFSVDQIKDRWQQLKTKYWKLKRILDTGEAPRPGLLADFPYFDELELLLGVQSGSVACRREADSSGLVSPLEMDPNPPDAESSHSGDEDISLGDFDLLLPEELDRNFEAMQGGNLPMPEGADGPPINPTMEVVAPQELRQPILQPAEVEHRPLERGDLDERLVLSEDLVQLNTLVTSVENMTKVVEHVATLMGQVVLQLDHLSTVLFKFVAGFTANEQNEQHSAAVQSNSVPNIPAFIPIPPAPIRQEVAHPRPLSPSLYNQVEEAGQVPGKSPRLKSRRACSVLVPRRSSRERRPSARFC